MRNICRVIIVIFLAIFDLAISTVVYCHGIKFYATFSRALSNYSFTTSVLELWVASVIRVAVVIGPLLGVCFSRNIGVERIKKCHNAALCFSGGLAMITLTKLLAVSEVPGLLDDPWFWALFAWSLASCVTFVGQWKVLCKLEFTRNTLLGHLRVNEDEADDTEPILENGKLKDSQKTEKDSWPSSARTLLRLVVLSKKDWWLILIGFIFLTLSASGEIFIPYYTGRVVDGIVLDKSKSEFTHNIIIMAVISAVSAISAGLRGFCLFLTNRRLNLRIRNFLFASILSQDVGFFDTLLTGDITSRLTSDTTTMSDALNLNVNICLRSLIKAGGVVFFMFKLSWRLTVVTFIGLPLMVVVSKVYGKYYERIQKKVQDSLAEANNVAEEACSTMRTVRSFANEQQEVQRYADKLGTTYSLYKKQAFMYAGFVWCNMLFELALTVSVLYYGGHLVLDGTITGGTLISFILYQLQLGACIDNLGYVYTGLMQASGASQKVFEYIDRQPAISHHGNLAPPTLQGHIEFKDVCFSYPSRPDIQVLKGVSFSVKAGEVVALVGPSGGGKSSCVNLLEYFYQPQSGQVLLDGQPVHDYDHHYLHKQVSLVGQEPVLYARSIEENIRYGLHEHEWTKESVLRAAEMANASQFISDLKDGYETQTGEKGVQMSGGQKQRIAIARALLRKPAVLLLDEATSALDAESEYLVQQALYKNLSGRTVFIIAHRLSTVERADRIIVINKGRVEETGTHRQLLHTKGLYSNLVRRQLTITDEAWQNDDDDDDKKMSVTKRDENNSNSSEIEKARMHVQGDSVLPGITADRENSRLSPVNSTHNNQFTSNLRDRYNRTADGEASTVDWPENGATSPTVRQYSQCVSCRRRHQAETSAMNVPVPTYRVQRFRTTVLESDRTYFKIGSI